MVWAKAMSRAVLIRKIVVEFNMDSISIFRDALANYDDYLKKSIEFEHDIHLTKTAIKRRIKKIESLIDDIESINDQEIVTQ